MPAPPIPIYLSITSADLAPLRADLWLPNAEKPGTSLLSRIFTVPLDGQMLANICHDVAHCGTMVQLVGHRYGVEPSPGSARYGRVSYAQFEALTAEEFGRPVTYVLLDPSFHLTSSPPEPGDLSQMQQWYREHLLAKPERRHVVSTRDGLQHVVRQILNQLPAPPRLASRELVRKAVLTMVSLVLIGWSAMRLSAALTPQPERVSEQEALLEAAHKEEIKGVVDKLHEGRALVA